MTHCENIYLLALPSHHQCSSVSSIHPLHQVWQLSPERVRESESVTNRVDELTSVVYDCNSVDQTVKTKHTSSIIHFLMLVSSAKDAPLFTRQRSPCIITSLAHLIFVPSCAIWPCQGIFRNQPSNAYTEKRFRHSIRFA